jgi:hypothetical protein
MYANLVDGSISSRQIVALALVSYNDRKRLLELERKLNE